MPAVHPVSPDWSEVRDGRWTAAKLSGLFQRCWSTLEQAYCPYSRYPVAAILVGADGSVHAGVNVENSSYGLTICAERSAVARAVTEGVTRFDLLVVATRSPRPVSPCGACRQVLAEFGRDLAVFLLGSEAPPRRVTLDELLPFAFSGEDLRTGD